MRSSAATSRKVKRVVAKAKGKVFDELCKKLDTKAGEKDLYQLTRQKDRAGKDVQQVRVLKNSYGSVLTSWKGCSGSGRSTMKN